jgi:hypothetical protein
MSLRLSNARATPARQVPEAHTRLPTGPPPRLREPGPVVTGSTTLGPPARAVRSASPPPGTAAGVRPGGLGRARAHRGRGQRTLPAYQSAGVSFQIESAVQNLGSGSVSSCVSPAGRQGARGQALAVRDPPIWTAGDSSAITGRGPQIRSFCAPGSTGSADVSALADRSNRSVQQGVNRYPRIAPAGINHASCASGGTGPIRCLAWHLSDSTTS